MKRKLLFVGILVTLLDGCVWPGWLSFLYTRADFEEKAREALMRVEPPRIEPDTPVTLTWESCAADDMPGLCPHGRAELMFNYYGFLFDAGTGDVAVVKIRDNGEPWYVHYYTRAQYEDCLYGVPGRGREREITADEQVFSRLRAQLKKVVIPDGATAILDGTFVGCTNLVDISIPASVREIGCRAFAGCTGLGPGPVYRDGCLLTVNDPFPSELVIPEGTRLMTRGLLRGCKALTSLTLPASLRALDHDELVGCDNLRSFKVAPERPDYRVEADVMYSGDGRCLVRCPVGTAGRVTIPDGVTSIGNEAFAHCTALTDVSIPASVTNIGERAFEDCPGLGVGVVIRDGCVLALNGEMPEVLDLPEGTRLVATGVFGKSSRRLREVRIPLSLRHNPQPLGICLDPTNGVASLTFPGEMRMSNVAFGSHIVNVHLTPGTRYLTTKAFGFVDFTSLEIPEGVREIRAEAFSYSFGLRHLKLPASLERIDPKALHGCRDFESFEIASANPYMQAQGGQILSKDGTCLLFSADGAGKLHIPASVTHIGEGVIDWMRVESLAPYNQVCVIDGCVLGIHQGNDCREVVLPEGARLIADDAFDHKYGIHHVTIPGSIAAISEKAFFGCRELRRVDIAEGVREIRSRAFADCRKLVEINIPASVTNIAADAFLDCRRLKTVTRGK